MLASVQERARNIALSAPDARLLNDVVRSLHLGSNGWEVFYGALVAHISESDSRQRAWVTALQDEISSSTRDISALTFKGAHLDGEAEAWSRTTDPLAVWDFGRHHVSYRDAPTVELHVLRRIDEQAWFSSFDNLPVPSLMWLVVWMSSLVEDPDLVEHLVIRAPPLFDGHGIWTRSVAAQILVRVIETYAERVHRAVSGRIREARDDSVQRALAEGDLRQLEDVELPERLRKFYGSLLARQDGHFIGYGRLQELASRALSTSRAAPTSDSVALRIGFGALVAALAGAGASVDDARAVWQDRETRKRQADETEAARPLVRGASKRKRVGERDGEGHGILHAEALPLFLGALAIQDLMPYRLANAEGLWTWFRELLIGRDPGFRWGLSDNCRDEATRRLGTLLAKLPDPAHTWQSTYKLLEPQRRRAQFGYRYEGMGHEDRESVFLIYVGLNGCASCIEKFAPNDDPTPMHDLFWALYDASRRLWLTAATDIGTVKKNLVAACFAFMPAVFGSNLNQAVPRALRSVGNDSWVLTRACCYLRLNGVEPAQLASLVSDADLDLREALRDAYEWSSLTGQKDEFPHDFKDLAEAIGYSLGDPMLPGEPALRP